MFRKRMQLALIHVAVAMTLVPINSTLNRVMIKELAISATLVSILASLPYLFAPAQVLIGSYSDRHPLFGWRRSPYILFGLLLCTAGVMLAPYAVYLMPDNRALGLLFTALTFGAWGLGYNLASVAYLSLASEISGEKGRSRTVAVMWFMMITGIILTSIALSRLLEPYSPQTLESAFRIVALVALGLGLLGVLGVEPRTQRQAALPAAGDRQTWQSMIRAVLANPTARRFFIYLTILLAAILGQDVLLEPFAAEAFGLPVEATTRITSIWGGCMLLALMLANALERPLGKKNVARGGALVAILGFILIAAAGPLANQSLFYSGVVLLGAGTGLATVSNLSLMFDMTTTQVGLFMGAWGVSNALSRFLGTILSGVVRDVAARISQNAVTGYLVVFLIEAVMLAATLFMLNRIDVQRFRQETHDFNLDERAALMNEAS